MNSVSDQADVLLSVYMWTAKLQKFAVKNAKSYLLGSSLQLLLFSYMNSGQYPENQVQALSIIALSHI